MNASLFVIMSFDDYQFQGFEIGSKLWLSDWANSKELEVENDGGPTSGEYITMYGLFGLFQSIAFLAAVLLVKL